MMDLRLPRFDWGLTVRACDDIFNDGTYPGEAEGALLVAKDSPGEIVRVGHHEEGNMASSAAGAKAVVALLSR